MEVAGEHDQRGTRMVAARGDQRARHRLLARVVIVEAVVDIERDDRHVPRAELIDQREHRLARPAIGNAPVRAGEQIRTCCCATVGGEVTIEAWLLVARQLEADDQRRLRGGVASDRAERDWDLARAVDLAEHHRRARHDDQIRDRNRLGARCRLVVRCEREREAEQAGHHRDPGDRLIREHGESIGRERKW